MFARLVVPLRERRRVRVEADFAEETASAYRRTRYDLSDIDIILLEGIYLLKREHRHHHDVSTWIDCIFDTALKRAVAHRGNRRRVQGHYLPAQELHFRRDGPGEAVSLILENDHY